MNNKLSLTLALLFFSLIMHAQSYKAQLNYDGNSGLHMIPIPINVRNIIGDRVASIRIKDEDGNDAPFVIYNNSAKISKQDFLEIAHVIHSKTDSSSIYIIPNNKSARNSVILHLANSAIRKNYTIDGSNDQKLWFSLLGNTELSNLAEENGTSIYKELYFPNTDFKYIRISIIDRTSAPILIKAFGDWSVSKQKDDFEIIPSQYFHINVTNNDKSTILTILKTGLVPVLKVKFYIKNSQDYYNREVSIYDSNNLINQGVLSSNTDNEIFLAPQSNKNIIVKIQNNDNKVLEFETINFYTKRMYILSQLDSGKHYHLEIDNSLTAPNYDLTKMNIPNQEFPKATIENITSLHSEVTTKNTPPKQYGKYILWIGIAIGVIIIFIFGNKLLKDLKANQS